MDPAHIFQADIQDPVTYAGAFKHGRFEFYSGWRERANFGMKLNLWQRLPAPNPQNKSGDQPADTPSSMAVPSWYRAFG
jgi:hypothetical protein